MRAQLGLHFCRPPRGLVAKQDAHILFYSCWQCTPIVAAMPFIAGPGLLRRYFSEAAALGHDGDSLVNAAHCLANGLGTPADQGAAVKLLER